MTLEQHSTNSGNSADNNRVILQERDRKLIQILGSIRFIDRFQATRIAPFHSASRAKTRLLALVRAGHLDHLFVGTIAGGRRAIYRLPENRRRHGPKLISSAKTELFVEHQLALNEIYLAMAFSERVRLVHWSQPTTALPDRHGVIPDAFAELTADGQRLGWFVEVDLETESLPIWEEKVDGYLRLARSDYVRDRHGLASFRVLVIARTEDRIQAIRSRIARSTDKVFWLSSTAAINSEGFWAAVWWRPSGEQRFSLL
jgi:hypothetical protein